MDNAEMIRVCDCTLRQGEKSPELSFREKIELCRLLDKLDIDMIELKEICRLHRTTGRRPHRSRIRLRQ